MKKIILISVIAVMVGMMTAEAQTNIKGSVMNILICDIDTTQTDDTTLVGYVFLEDYETTTFDSSGKEHKFEMTEYVPRLEEVREAEILLLKKYRIIMSVEKNWLGRVITRRPDLNSYIRQYIFGVASDGKRYVWINAVSKEATWLMDELEDRTIHIRDGGNFFWQTLLNLDNRTMVFNIVNGEA